MSNATTNMIGGEHDRYVFVERPHCPRCDGTDLKTIRSKTEDGTTTRRTVCQSCGHRFFVVLE